MQQVPRLEQSPVTEQNEIDFFYSFLIIYPQLESDFHKTDIDFFHLDSMTLYQN